MRPAILTAFLAAGLIIGGRGIAPPRPSAAAPTARSSAVPSDAPLQPVFAAIDSHPAIGTSSNLNGILEPGESVQVSPFWQNVTGAPQSFTGTASNLTGPGGPTYTIDDASAGYGSLAGGATTDCDSATGNCYVMTVSGARPVLHWDVTFDENLSVGGVATTWTVHVGSSFFDVPTTAPFYPFIEKLLHMEVTTGCGSGNYCPNNPVTRAQMAVFLLKAEHGSSYVPPPCTGIFGDVSCPSQFADWIEQLFNEGITGGCQASPLLYCPNNPVTRAQMAVFLLKTEHGSAYHPPLCQGLFNDVPCPSLFADWIEQLFNEGVTGGCGGGNYCPDASVTRGQMAVFLTKLFAPPSPPLPTPTPTRTPTITPTPITPTITFTPHPPTPTVTPSFTKTFTNTPITPTPTFTFTPGSPTLTPTNTPITPTSTFTKTFTKTFTNTPITPTITPTPTPNTNHIVSVGAGPFAMSFVDTVSGTFVSTIPVGTTLEWDWVSSTHSSTSGTCSSTNCVPDGLWNSGQHNSGFVYTRQFNTVGTFNYYCSVHTVNMVGVVNVIPITPTPLPGARRR